MILIIAVTIGWGIVAGFILFRKNTTINHRSPGHDLKLSVIIPARNEEHQLPNLLQSLQAQTFTPHEIIVVDDGSVDRTAAVARQYGATVVSLTELPPGWTGKNWSVWNGYLHATGDVLAFLDADVRLATNALETLLHEQATRGGVISVIPYHHTEKYHERLALIFNVLGAFAFMSPFEQQNEQKALYGSCIVATRSDYEAIGGHESIKFEVLDDMKLGARFTAAGIGVTTLLGYKLVRFRMYPQHLRSVVEGFSKGAVTSTANLHPMTVLLNACWLIGLIVAQSCWLFVTSPLFVPLAIGYVIYMLQLYYFTHYVGRFGHVMHVLHVVPTIFFLIVMVYSLYQVAWRGQVVWKGRNIKIGGGGEQ